MQHAKNCTRHTHTQTKLYYNSIHRHAGNTQTKLYHDSIHGHIDKPQTINSTMTDRDTDGRTEFSSLERVCVRCSILKTVPQTYTHRQTTD